MAAALLSFWGTRPGPGSGGAVVVDWPENITASEASRLLSEQALIQSPGLFRLLYLGASPFLRISAGEHLLTDDASPFELLRRLARLSSRARTRVTLPEGFNRFQIAERLEQHRICPRETFLAATEDSALLLDLGVRGSTAEGYLFPATYELYLNARAPELVRILVRETRRRFEAVSEKHPGALRRLSERYDWSEHDVLTFASIVEKESSVSEELPLVASVFFNRLNDATFRPLKMLQSDPTAAYGCLVDPALVSCAGYAGRVSAAMLRDAANPYNTYRHPGLPPGPIANPSERALAAVLSPADTDYLFFVANGSGKHTFSRTLVDHEAAIPRKNDRAAPR